jgi:hypothetical protein
MNLRVYCSDMPGISRLDEAVLTMKACEERGVLVCDATQHLPMGAVTVLKHYLEKSRSCLPLTPIEEDATLCGVAPTDHLDARSSSLLRDEGISPIIGALGDAHSRIMTLMRKVSRLERIDLVEDSPRAHMFINASKILVTLVTVLYQVPRVFPLILGDTILKEFQKARLPTADAVQKLDDDFSKNGALYFGTESREAKSIRDKTIKPLALKLQEYATSIEACIPPLEKRLVKALEIRLSREPLLTEKSYEFAVLKSLGSLLSLSLVDKAAAYLPLLEAQGTALIHDKRVDSLIYELCLQKSELVSTTLPF